MYLSVSILILSRTHVFLSGEALYVSKFRGDRWLDMVILARMIDGLGLGKSVS